LALKNSSYDDIDNDNKTKIFNIILINYSLYEIPKIKNFKDNMNFYHDIDKQIFNLQLLIKNIIFYLNLKIISEFNN
jgi:hypothetical protein